VVPEGEAVAKLGGGVSEGASTQQSEFKKKISCTTKGIRREDLQTRIRKLIAKQLIEDEVERYKKIHADVVDKRRRRSKKAMISLFKDSVNWDSLQHICDQRYYLLMS